MSDSIVGETRDGTFRITTTGRLVFSLNARFRNVARDALASPATTIEVDLASVNYVDSAALGMLLWLRDAATQAGKNVVLSGVHGVTKTVFEVAHFEKLFKINP